MSDPTRIEASAAPAAIGPYVHAIRHGDVVYCSGSIALDPETGELDGGSLGDETRGCLRNLQIVCAAAGTDLRHALRMTIYTTDLAGFAEINEAYGEVVGDLPPARVTVGVDALPKGARVEIDAIVAVG